MRIIMEMTDVEFSQSPSSSLNSYYPAPGAWNEQADVGEPVVVQLR